MEESILKILLNVPLFTGLRNEDLNKIGKCVEVKEYTKNDIILRESDPGDVFFIIDTGQVKISRSSKDGKEVILAYLHEGNFFGEIALLDKLGRTATIQAREDSKLLLIRQKNFLSILKQYPTITFGLLRELSLRLRRIDQQIESYVFKESHRRVAFALYRYIEEIDGSLETHLTLPKLSVKSIAQMLSLSEGMTYRVIADFIRQGLLKKKDGNFVILNCRRLRQMVI